MIWEWRGESSRHKEQICKGLESERNEAHSRNWKKPRMVDPERGISQREEGDSGQMVQSLGDNVKDLMCHPKSKRKPLKNF